MNRLSGDPGTRVLVVEAGGRDTNPRLHIPAVISGNTSAATIMIAEKAADPILARTKAARAGGGAPARAA